MSVSRLAGAIKESPTLALNEKARQLREKGEAVIHLGSGEPKSKVPFDAILGATAKLATADIRYTSTAGIPQMIQAVIEYTRENYGYKPDKKEIIVSNGAKHSLFNLMVTLIDPGDEIVILVPYWVSYPEIIKMVHGVPVEVLPEDGKFEPTIESITSKVTQKTKAIIVNSPNNPSGKMYSDELIAELVKYCEENDIYLVMDDIYHKLIFDGKRPVSVYKYAKNLGNDSKLIVINGVSKLYSMTGFRVGWAIANRKITEAMINVQAQNSSCTSVVVQAAAVGALTGNQNCTESLRLTLENHCNIMMNELGAIEGLKTIKPDGTFYCLPDFRAYSNDSVKLSEFLLEKALVVTVPGKEFGLEGHLRLSYCGSVKDITEGVARIKWALDKNSPGEINIGDRKVVRNW